jgi:hypothetical protein
MKKLAHLLPLLLASLAAAPACDEGPETADDATFGEPPPEEVFGAEWRGWGYTQSTVVLNTNILNGTSVDTIRFGLPTMYGTEVNWVYTPVHGEFLDMGTVQVVDGAIKGTTEGGTLADAYDFDGSIWSFQVGGEEVWVVLDEVKTASNAGLANAGSKMMTNLDPARMVYKWTSSWAPAAGVKVDPKTGWGGSYDGLHTCPTDPHGDTWTVMYRGLLVDRTTGDVASATWAPQEYAYIACLGGRIGKTSLWGYAPDNPSANVPDMTLEQFEGAHRMVGAEYCGDSRSYTRAGEAVTLKDKWTINTFEGSATSDEAVWGLSGAICVGTPRWEAVSAPPIVCNDGRTIPSCGISASSYYANLSGAKWWTRNAWFAD